MIRFHEWVFRTMLINKTVAGKRKMFPSVNHLQNKDLERELKFTLTRSNLIPLLSMTTAGYIIDDLQKRDCLKKKITWQ
jgi:hypothetical protein